MKKTKSNVIFITVALALILFTISGCSTPTPTIVEVTREVIQTRVVTQLVEVVITATPEPATSTPEATITPENTPTPDFAKYDTDDIVEAFESAGLEFEDSYRMEAEDYGFAPMMATEGIRFLIPSLCPDCGGRLFAFDNPASLAATKAYYEELGRQSAVLFSWVFEKNNILVQINGDLPRETAEKYKSVLDNLE